MFSLKPLLTLRQKLLCLLPSIIWPKYIEYDGALIPLRAIQASFGNKYLILSRQYELPERILASQFVTKGMTIVEIGSSIGILSSYLAKLVGINGCVVALEGSYKKHAIAKGWSQKYYSNLFFENSYGLPVWSINNPISIKGIEDSISTLGGRPLFSHERDNQSDSKGPLCLKNISSKYNLTSIDALVVDIEGSEEEILFHDLDLPPELSYILIELHPYAYSSLNTKQDIIDRIQLSGFRLIHVLESSYLFSR